MGIESVILFYTTKERDLNSGRVRSGFILSVRKLRRKCSVAMVYWVIGGLGGVSKRQKLKNQLGRCLIYEIGPFS